VPAGTGTPNQRIMNTIIGEKTPMRRNIVMMRKKLDIILKTFHREALHYLHHYYLYLEFCVTLVDFADGRYYDWYTRYS